MNKDFSNSFWSGVQFSSSLVLSLLGLKINLLTFGEETFSVWILLLSLWGVGSVLDLGFGISLIRIISQNKSDAKRVSKIISTGFLIFATLGIIIAVILSLTGELFFFNNPKLIPLSQLSISRLTFYLLGLNFYFQYITFPIKSIFEGYSDYLSISKVAILTSVIQFTLVVVCYLLRLNLIFLVFSYITANIIQFIFLYLKTRRKKIAINPFKPDFSILKFITVSSISIQFTYLLGALIDPVIKWLLGNYSEKSYITSYEIARRFSIAVSGLFNFSFRNSLPKASLLKTATEYKIFIFKNGVNLSKLGTLFSGIQFGIFSILYTLFFILFYKNEHSLTFFIILSLVESTNILGYILYVSIIGIGKTHFLILTQTITLILTSLILLYDLKVLQSGLGNIGQYFSVMITYFVMIYYLGKLADFKVIDFLKKTKFIKSFLFQFILIADLLVLQQDFLDPIILQIIFSSSCFIIFLNDIKKFLKTFKSRGIDIINVAK